MLVQMIQIEQWKLSRRVIFWVELALMAVVALGMIVLLFIVRQMLASGITESGGFRVEGIDGPQAQAMLTWPVSFSLLLGVAGTWGSFLLVVLSGAVTAQEYSWRSFQLWLSRGVPRWHVVVAKFTAVMLAALLLVTVTVVVGGVITGALSRFYLGEVPFAVVNWGRLGLAVLITAYALLPYATLAMLLAIASRSTALTVGAGLAFVTLVEPLAVQLLPLLGEWATTLARYFPASLAQVTGRYATGESLATVAGAVSPLTAVTLLGVYTLLFLGMAVLIFQRQELGG